MEREADGRFDGPPTVDLLADLQAGRLDEQTAARLRQRVRAEPAVAEQLAALDRVRRELAELGTDAASAPDVPADVAARVGNALRAEPPVAQTPSSRFRRAAAVAGAMAALAAATVGTLVLIDDGPPAPPVPTPDRSSLSDGELDVLLRSPPELGPLASPPRRTSCLSALGYPSSTTVLGAGPHDVDGRPGILLLLPGETPGGITAVVVAPNCSSANTGLLLSRVVGRP